MELITILLNLTLMEPIKLTISKFRDTRTIDWRRSCCRWSGSKHVVAFWVCLTRSQERGRCLFPKSEYWGLKRWRSIIRQYWRHGSESSDNAKLINKSKKDAYYYLQMNYPRITVVRTDILPRKHLNWALFKLCRTRNQNLGVISEKRYLRLPASLVTLRFSKLEYLSLKLINLEGQLIRYPKA